jgi:hypothetical protein
MHWKTKAALFRIFDNVPFGEHLHYLAQRHVTRTWPRPEEDVKALVGAAIRYVEDFRRYSTKPLEQAVFFEIGAGRDLIVPLTLRLFGVKKVLSSDVKKLAKLKLVNAAAKVISRHCGESIPTFESWSALADYGVIYLAPFDASTENIPTNDAFISNEVLEHIPPDAMRRIFENVVGSLRPGAVSVHSIDYSDHYARDGTVSRYNFLRYSDQEWRRFNANLHYVNRLRHSEYVNIISKTDLKIVGVELAEGDYPESLLLDEKFVGFKEEDLRIIRSRIVSIKLIHDLIS